MLLTHTSYHPPEMRKNRKNKTRIFFANKNARFVSAVPKGVLQKIKNKNGQTLGFEAFAGNEGMGGQRR